MCYGCKVREEGSTGREIDIFTDTAWLVRRLIELVSRVLGRTTQAAA